MYTTEPNVSKDSVYYRGNQKDTMLSSLAMINCLGHYIYQAGYNLKRESFDSFLIMYIKKGSMNICINNNSFTLHENDSIVLNCYVPHSYGTTHGAEVIWLHIAGTPIYNATLNICNNNHGIIPSSYCARISNLCEYLLDYFATDNNTICDYTISKMLYNSIIDICKEINNTNCNNIHITGADAINRTIHYIKDNYNKNITVCELADMASFSKYYYIRVFKAITGATPHEYIINERLWHASFLIQNTTMSFKDIAYTTGFTDECSFHNTFKRIKGCTPGQYRLGINNIL